jgi:hypothetical protein
MNFREAMRHVLNMETVRVTPDTSGGNPHLVRVVLNPDADQMCLQCVCLTEDGKRIEPGEIWEPVCFLLCFDEYLDGEWEVVDADDHTCKEVA